MYFSIYQSNAAIEELTNSSGVSTELKKQLIGEVKFIRAFCYFYLVSLFGDVPLVVNTDWSTNYLLSRSTKDEIFNQIIFDLTEAQQLLVDNYTKFQNNERGRVNKWAATSMLARIYLYLKDWNKAESEATKVINNSALFQLESDLSQTFIKTSKEGIWQLAPSNQTAPYIIVETANLVPASLTSKPIYYLTSSILNLFEANDKRKTNWTRTNVNGGTNYLYPYKYKKSTGTSGGTITEYYTVLRLAEQFLIRAEASAQQNNLTQAIIDLNAIRARAGISILSSSLTQSQILAAVEKERATELFAEWGHRWLDLKRWGKADAIVGQLKGNNWQTSDQLLPIPKNEINKGKNLTQNEGYY
jgi:hypothetical protein